MAWWCLMLPQEDMDGASTHFLVLFLGRKRRACLLADVRTGLHHLGAINGMSRDLQEEQASKGQTYVGLKSWTIQRCLEILQLSFRNQLAITTPSCMEPYLWCCRLTSKFSPVRFAKTAKNHQVSPWFICAKLPWKVFHLRQKAVFG